MRLTDLHLRWRAARERNAVAGTRFPKLFQDAQSACWRVGAVALGAAAITGVTIRAGWLDIAARPFVLGTATALVTVAAVHHEAQRLVVKHLERQALAAPERSRPRLDLINEAAGPIARRYCPNCQTHAGIRHRRDCSDVEVRWLNDVARRARLGRGI